MDIKDLHGLSLVHPLHLRNPRHLRLIFPMFCGPNSGTTLARSCGCRMALTDELHPDRACQNREEAVDVRDAIQGKYRGFRKVVDSVCDFGAEHDVIICSPEGCSFSTS